MRLFGRHYQSELPFSETQASDGNGAVCNASGFVCREAADGLVALPRADCSAMKARIADSVLKVLAFMARSYSVQSPIYSSDLSARTRHFGRTFQGLLRGQCEKWP